MFVRGKGRRECVWGTGGVTRDLAVSACVWSTGVQRGYTLAQADELKLRARPRGAPGVTVADTGGRPAGGSGGGGANGVCVCGARSTGGAGSARGGTMGVRCGGCGAHWLQSGTLRGDIVLSAAMAAEPL